MEILRARRERYTKARPPLDPAGRIVIVVDDGIATGSSMLAAIRSIRARHPATIVVAAAVAPPESLSRIADEADEIVCLHTPHDFAAVGQFFDDFSDVTDDMVVEALASRRPAAARQTP
jgi:predicted phosphoribosyltransferase